VLSPTQFVTLLAAARARRREQWLAPVELKRLRGSRPRRLALAGAKTAHYGRHFQEAGLEPEHLADERELARLPVLEKTILHAAKENGFLAETVKGLFPLTRRKSPPSAPATS
jgi:phenylacetate-coenzyme A ligase PaaK-like adenylate-forming protein